MDYKVTHNNNELRLNNINEIVKLRGWVSKKRDLGGLLFIDLRDREGITQLVVNPNSKIYQKALEIKNEYIIKVSGKVVERQSKNKNIPTGDVEVIVDELDIINTSEQPPIIIQDKTDALEDTRLKYRYLDLRRPVMKKYLVTRSKVLSIVRNYLEEKGFLELETPVLTKSSPEGARDYLVPSRVYKGQFYALPQSPQLFKQIYMVAGFEKYYQIAKCFRDEDLRADRQPEFFQIDIEESFITEEDIYELIEGLYKKIFKEILNIELKTPFRRITYDYAMDNYGSDKPDLRYDLLIQDFNEIFKKTEFQVFKDVLTNNGYIKGLIVNGNFSRKHIDEFTNYVKLFKAKGLAWFKYENNEISGSISKFLNKEEILRKLNLKNNDYVFIVSDINKNIVNISLGELRKKLAKELNLIKEGYEFTWVYKWPLFEYLEEDQKYHSLHHPFTLPMINDLKELDNPDNIYAYCYDIVLNGYEVGGGSLRIHNQKMQHKIFEILGLTNEEIDSKFGWFVNALKYGTPPHGGIALGLERMIMQLTNTDNIRDVVAFPKTQNARCLMTDSPSEVDQEQLDELGIKTK